MSTRKSAWLGMTIGYALGTLVGQMISAGMFSLLLLGALGAAAGIWVAFQLNR